MQDFVTALISPEKLFRAGLKSVLAQAGHNVVGEWDSIQAVDESSADQGGLVLLDASANSQEFAAHVVRARERFQRARIVVLSNEESIESVRAVKAAGAAGFIAKDSSSRELMGLLKDVANGQNVFPVVQDNVELELHSTDPETAAIVEKPDPRELCRELGLLAAINTCRRHRWTDLLRVIQAEREAALAVPQHW